MVAPHMSPAEQFEENDLNERIQDAIVELSIDYRIVIVLRHFADLSHRELSFVLDISEKTVKSRLYTARRLLSGILLKRGIAAND